MQNSFLLLGYIVRFVDIGGIDDHQYLNFLFTTIAAIVVSFLG